MPAGLQHEVGLPGLAEGVQALDQRLHELGQPARGRLPEPGREQQAVGGAVGVFDLMHPRPLGLQRLRLQPPVAQPHRQCIGPSSPVVLDEGERLPDVAMQNLRAGAHALASGATISARTYHCSRLSGARKEAAMALPTIASCIAAAPPRSTRRSATR